MAALQGIPEEEREPKGSVRRRPNELPERKLRSGLKRFEQVWSELVECLGPNSEKALLELKQRTLRDLQRPSRKHLAYYKELFHLSEKQLKTIAEVTSGQAKSGRVDRSRIHAGCALDLELGDDLLSDQVQESICTYIRHECPGLVMIYPSRARPDQRFSLRQNFMSMNNAGMKKFVDCRRKGRQLLEFVCRIGRLCSELGLNYVIDCPWPLISWQSRCLKEWEKHASAVRGRYGAGVPRLPDSEPDPRKLPLKILTNQRAIVRTVELEQQQRGSLYNHQLVALFIKAHATITCRDPKKVKVVRYNEICAEDRNHDEAYFTPVELQEIYQTKTNKHSNHKEIHIVISEKVLEVMHEEGHDTDLNRRIFPDAYGLTEEQVRTEGWHELEGRRWLHVAKESGDMMIPEAGHPAESLPWRSTCTKKGAGAWLMQEDEIQWQDLRDQQRRLPLQDWVVTIFQAKIHEESPEENEALSGNEGDHY